MNSNEQTNEMIKTAAYAGVAFVLVIVGMGTYPRAPKLNPIDEVNSALFTKFTDSEDAVKLEISRVDVELGKLHRFEVERSKKGWVIPSHSDYPADAEDQMRDAATLLTGLVVKDVRSDATEKDFKDFGVIEPDPKKTTLGQTGVGVLVKMEDKNGNDLAKIVVGNQVGKDDENLRFVRIPGQDPIYTVELDMDKISTKFEDWIEEDLLKLTALDLEDVTLKDYSVALQPTPNGGLSVDYAPRMEVKVKTDTTEGWVLKQMHSYNQKGEPVPTHISELEELNDDALDDLKSALDDLEIVDVRRKPEGVAANLKGDESLLENNEVRSSLFEIGIYPIGRANKEVELLSSNGEVIATMEDGVEYVLRFGKTAGTEEGTDKLNRYLFVMARVNMDKLPEPEYETPPEVEDDEEEPKEGEKKEDEKKETSEVSDDEADDVKQNDDETEKEETEKEETAKDADKEEEAADEGDESEVDEQDAEEAKKAKEKADRKAERERILNENKRKLDEHEGKVKEAKDRVTELNERFADWYYVVSEDMYKKMRLRRADLVKEKDTAEEEGFGIDAFRKLEKDGLKKEDEDDDNESDDV